MTQYRAVVGVDYPPNKRVEAGQLVDDLPEKDVKWLLSSGFIEAVDGKGKTITPVVEEEVIAEPVVEEVIAPEATVEITPEVIDLSDGVSAEEAKAILETAALIEEKE